MAAIDCTESGLVFRFEESELFRPELDPAVEKLQGVKRCDFITYHNSRYLHFIEVQNSAPSPAGDKDALKKELDECLEKFMHSLLLFLSHYCKRRVFSTFPSGMNALKLAALPIRFILLLPEFDKEGCSQIQNKLQLQTVRVHRAFGKIEAFVVNKENAHKKGIHVSVPSAH